MTKIRLSISAACVGLICSSFPAGAEVSRSVLPIPLEAFSGKISEDRKASTPVPRRTINAPQGAPNIVLFMSDDVGFAMSSTFGGPVPTPNLDRLASTGERYNRFHTTAICSATRAALLTGRNHHAVGTGYVSDTPLGYPGYDAHFPASAATIARILTLNGYNTAMFGKHHNVPTGEDTAAGPFDMWPTGLGFEYFYGWIVADTDQFHPNLYRGTNRITEPDGPLPMLDRRMADDAISWIHNQQAAAPDKPFFVYYAPGSLHAPQQAPAEYISRFKGQFSQGWDTMREESRRKQLAMGIIPADTALTQRPPEIPAWDSLSTQQKQFAARSMEVAAGMLAYQDEQFGRLIAELERMGKLDNTLVMFLQGDNGAEAGAGPDGTINEIGMTNRVIETDTWRMANLDKLGGPHTYPNYPAGWAWAMNTPFRWAKQYTSMLGGIRNGMVLSWQGHVASPGSVCNEFGHVVDVLPTILEAANIAAPRSVYGVDQQPLDGKSLLPSLSACKPDRQRTQYFEMVGKIGLYHDGWFASRDDGRLPWKDTPPPNGENQPWALYDLRSDFSQSRDVAAQHPEIMRLMLEIWQKEASRNNVFPLDHRFAGARFGMTPTNRKTFDFWGKDVSLLANRGPMFAGRSFTLEAEVQLEQSNSSGVITALGSHFGGWSFYLEKGRPVFTYASSTNPDDITTIKASRRLQSGTSKVRLNFQSDGFLKGAAIEITQNGNSLANGRIGRTFLTPAGLGETFDIGRDLGVTVTPYANPHGEIEGDVRHVRIDFK